MGIIASLIILIILIFIVEVLSIALKLTGLDLDKARFQVISIITNTGFTTNEAELITQHATRRKIAQILMLISYVGYATLIGLIVNILQSNYRLIYITVITMIVLLGILIVIRNKWLIYRLEKIIEKQLLKRMNKIKKRKTVEEVLNLNDEFGIAEIVIEEGCGLKGKSLAESDLTQKNIQVLNIDRGSHIIHFPRNHFVFKEGDKVTVYGQLESIRKLVLKQYADVETN
ncbi:cation:proton antiporter regulatory subunit [Thermohalobacter berrensis]|uniref:Potassium transporter TrkA n=1 Tax=Thermohalobacter berrensis TaxID=99594 RepID=A0A419SV90_9FIRM|nr:TrkA C-terminal domain-containing protein [Thermohalobacter berrensis]RKD29125.1 potassium transporter TrkA [Thermohalobacter berrensis]